MVIYNFALYTVFLTLFQFVHRNYKTLYSFLDLGSSNFFSKVLIMSLFSMAGVPPFLGFFSKIFIFSLLCNSNFFILFPFFFYDIIYRSVFLYTEHQVFELYCWIKFYTYFRNNHKGSSLVLLYNIFSTLFFNFWNILYRRYSTNS